ncbi:MAG: histidine kinase [Gammaproteobacteria bacterium]
MNRTLLAGGVFASGCLLILSVLSLVQNHILVPLFHIRSWAERIREGRYSDPVPVPSYPAMATLADDLNKIASRINSSNNNANRNRGGGAADLEEKSLQILYEVVSSINTSHGLDDLLSRFMYTLKRTTKARAAAIWVGHHRKVLELAASSGIDESLIRSKRHEVCRCLYERALTEGKIWVDGNLRKCEKIAGLKFFDSERTGLVSIPMRYRGRITGVINLFADDTLISQIESIKPLLTSIAHHLSMAIEKSHNEEENRRHLINDERTRIAHELHDSLAQSLASIRYQVRVLDETMHQGDESTTWQQLERIENSLDEANTELRGLIANFRAPVHKRGLLEAIEQIVGQFRNETRIRTYLQKEWSASRFPKEVETQILRIIQEALWNIRKHSDAKTVRIMLRDKPDGRCHILIEDDGIGISKQVDGSEGEHIGLTIMRERAYRIGGKLRVESEPGEGTRIMLELNQCNPDEQ